MSNTVTLVSVDTLDIINDQQMLPVQVLTLDGKFDTFVDTVELHTYNANKELVDSEYSYQGWRSYQDNLPAGDTRLDNILVDPIKDANNVGIYNGLVYTLYNFVTNQLLSSDNNLFFIYAISADRTQITLKSNQLVVTPTMVADFKQFLDSKDYFVEFMLNFADNRFVVATNIRTTDNGLEIKLFEALPETFDIDSECWIQTKVADTVAYQVEFSNIVELPDTKIYIKGPNNNLKVNQTIGNSTEYKSESDLISVGLSSLQPQIQNLLNQKGIQLNIDYSNFNEFIYFSSAAKRLLNYKEKVDTLENYSASLASITSGFNTTQLYVVSQSNQIKFNFDGYEHYLYYKQNLTSSAYLTTWLNSGNYTSASYYDEENENNLIYSIPAYLREDESNQPYATFVEMIGQHFDTLYLYTKAIGDRYNNDNRLEFGISKGLVADALKGFGMQIYQNNFSTDDLYVALLGLTPSGSIPNQTTTVAGMLQPGQEWIQTIVSASAQPYAFNDINLSTYKRLYHNLPTLIKKKGTLAGLQQLITLYGIPDTVLSVSEFGAQDNNLATWDYATNKYDYTLSGSTVVSSNFQLNPTWNSNANRPEAVAFSIKTNDSSSAQLIFEADLQVAVLLTPHVPTTAPATFVGQPLDTYYNYATMSLQFAGGSETSIFAPFYNDEWWGVAINRDVATNTFTLHAQCKNYGLDFDNIVTFATSSQVVVPIGDTSWTTANNATIGVDGQLQEIHYYAQPISEYDVAAYTFNNYATQHPNKLAFRASLGGELFTQSTSIHPNQTTSSFAANSTFTRLAGTYEPNNVQHVHQNWISAGIKAIQTNKIFTTASVAENNVVSKYASMVTQQSPTSTATNYLEVAFSPQNQINEKILATYTNLNLGELIGDPRYQSSKEETYLDLDAVQNDYFKNYTSSYNWIDYLRLVKYFDNSLFKLIRDFIPAKSAAATGVVIKAHLLERNRVAPAQTSWESLLLETELQAQANNYVTGALYSITGAPAGAVNQYINYNQAWTSSVYTKAGIVSNLHATQEEFVNGEYSGSLVTVTTGELQNNPLLQPQFQATIGDYQNVGVGRSTFYPGNLDGLDINSGYYTGSGIIIFNQRNINSSFYNTATGVFSPEFSVVSNVNVDIFADYRLGGEDATEFEYTIGFKNLTTNQIVKQTRFTFDNVSLFPTDYQFTTNLAIENELIVKDNQYVVFWSGSADASGDGSGIIVEANAYTNFSIISENLAAQSTYFLDPTVYTQQNFAGNLNQYSEFNAIYNNVYSNRVSNKYYTVDYGLGLQPTNLAAIQSQSAIFAQIQDSDYDSTSAFFKTRFLGTQQTIPAFNQGKEPTVDQKQSFMAYYEYAGSTLPTRVGSNNFRVLYLIDEEGTIYQANSNTASIYWLNSTQNFENNGNFDILTYKSANTNNSNFTRRSVQVHRALSTAEPILYTSTGSLGKDFLVSGSYATISFETDPSVTPLPVFLTARKSPVGFNQTLAFAATANINFDVPVKETNVTSNIAGNLFTVNEEAYRRPVTVNYRVRLLPQAAVGALSARIRLIVDGGVAQLTNVPFTTAGTTVNLTTNTAVGPNSTIQVSVQNTSASDTITIGSGVLTLATELIVQDQTNITATRNFWNWFGTPDNVLFPSEVLSNIFNSSVRQVNINGAGYSQPILFDIQKFDEFRFESSEANLYVVKDVVVDSRGKLLQVEFNKDIDPTKININDFVIRRYVDNSNFHLINTRTISTAGPGFIFPKYPSDKLKANFDAIVQDFAAKNLL